MRTQLTPRLVAPAIQHLLSSMRPSPEAEMYLHMLFGGGKQRGLPAAMRGPDADRLLSRIAVASTRGYDPDGLRTNYGMSHQSAYEVAREPDNPWQSSSPELSWARTLGTFKTMPVGKDSVAIADSYDFNNDVGLGAGLDWLIRLAQRFGKPYSIRDTIYAPIANATIRQQWENRAKIEDEKYARYGDLP